MSRKNELEFYPLKYALKYIIDSKPILSISEANVMYRENIDLEKNINFVKRLHLAFLNGDISTRYWNSGDRARGALYRENKWTSLQKEMWDGDVDWNDNKVRYIDQDCGVDIEYFNVQVKVSDLITYASKSTRKLNDEMTEKGKHSVYKIIYTMAEKKYGLTSHSRDVTSKIEGDMHMLGLSLDKKTIKKWLDEAKDYVKSLE